MSYLEQTLLKGEKVTNQEEVHWACILFPAFFTVFLGYLLVLHVVSETRSGLILTLNGILWFLAFKSLIRAVILTFFSELFITDKRLIAKYGLIARETMELSLNRIESVNIDQGIIGRIFNYGSVWARGIGEGGTKFLYVKRPIELRKKILEIQTKQSQ